MSDTPLPNPRHELFAQGLAAGKPAPEAYFAAGYNSPNKGNASNLIKTNPQIAKRVADLQQRNVAKRDEHAAVSVAQCLTELEQARTRAMEAGRFNDAIAAVTAKAKLSALWIEKSERTNVRVDAAKLSDEELVARIMADSDT